MGRVSVFIAGLVVGGLIAGGTAVVLTREEAADEPVAAGSPAPPASPAEATPSPSASPSEIRPEEPATLSEASRLRLDGIGGLTVGMTAEEAEAAIGEPIRVEADFSSACRYARLADEDPKDLAFMVLDGKIGRIDVFNHSKIETVSGIAIGDSEGDVLSAYPGRIREEPHPYLGDQGSYLVYEPETDTHLSLIFETRKDKVISFRSGLEEPVGYIEGCA